MSTIQNTDRKKRGSARLSDKRLHDEVEDHDHDEQPRKRVTNDKRSRQDSQIDADSLVTESIGDLFASAPSSVLVHACNCEGSWGGGIALAFNKKYPAACQIYKDHCAEKTNLIGTCLLIPPQTTSDDAGERKRDHWIGCLFTSVGKGRNQDSKASILKATTPAMKDLLQQVKQCKADASSDDDTKNLGEIKMCKINSGLFGVPWKRTRTAIEQVLQEHGGEVSVDVVSRSEDD